MPWARYGSSRATVSYLCHTTQLRDDVASGCLYFSSGLNHCLEHLFHLIFPTATSWPQIKTGNKWAKGKKKYLDFEHANIDVKQHKIKKIFIHRLSAIYSNSVNCLVWKILLNENSFQIPIFINAFKALWSTTEIFVKYPKPDYCDRHQAGNILFLVSITFPD